MEVVVAGAGVAREAERPQRFICGLPIAVIPGIIRQHIVHPHLHAPFGAHRHADGQVGTATCIQSGGERVGDRAGTQRNGTCISGYREIGISPTRELSDDDP